MADSDVLAAVSDTLRSRMTAAMAGLSVPPPVAELHDLSSQPQTDPPRVTLFLYDIVEEAATRNRAPTIELIGGALRTRKQPLSLALYYMVTAWGGSRDTEQRMLGRVMQRMYDDAVIDGLELQGSLAGSAASLRVSLAPLRLDDRARVWWAIGRPYRLSVNYEVRVIDIDATVTVSAAPVSSRVLSGGVTAPPVGVTP